MEESKEVLDNLIEQAESYVRRNYSRDSKLIKLIGRIKAVRDVQRNHGSTLLDPKVIDILVSNLKDALPDWIPVEDKLPDDGEKVLVTYRLGVTAASYMGNKMWQSGNRKLKSVTAWQKFPEPYRKEKRWGD